MILYRNPHVVSIRCISPFVSIETVHSDRVPQNILIQMDGYTGWIQHTMTHRADTRVYGWVTIKCRRLFRVPSKEIGWIQWDGETGGYIQWDGETGGYIQWEISMDGYSQRPLAAGVFEPTILGYGKGRMIHVSAHCIRLFCIHPYSKPGLHNVDTLGGYMNQPSLTVTRALAIQLV